MRNKELLRKVLVMLVVGKAGGLARVCTITLCEAERETAWLVVLDKG